MSEGSLPQFNASQLRAQTTNNAALLAIKTDKERQSDICSFLHDLLSRANSASTSGSYSCEVSYFGKFKTEINAELSKRGFKYKWDTYDGDSFCIVSWEK